MKLTHNEEEAANRAEASVLLIRAGFRVYRPEADVGGEDLVLRNPKGTLLSVQLKGRPYVEWLRYGGRQVWMLFPQPHFVPGREWFLVDHDVLYEWVKARHSHTPGWCEKWSYPTVSKALREFLEPYRIIKGVAARES